MAKTVAFGELLIDFTTESEKDGYPVLAAHPGGAPANFLAAAANMGVEAAMVGKVGKDSFGALLKDTLNQHGINSDFVYEDENVFTTLAFVTLDKAGDRSFSFARKPGADTCITVDEIPYNLIDEADVFHFGTLSFTHEPSRTACMKAVEYARKKGKLISFDPNYRPALWNSEADAVKAIKWGLCVSDIVKISGEELQLVTQTDEINGISLLLEEYGCQLVFVTLGKEGCIAGNSNTVIRVPNYENVTTVDTTGAGDIFGGTAVAGVLETGASPEEINAQQLGKICTLACTAASLSTEKYGGISSIPDKNDVITKGNENEAFYIIKA